MRDQTLFYWGTIVTLFLFFAALLTAQELFESYMERRDRARSDDAGNSSD